MLKRIFAPFLLLACAVAFVPAAETPAYPPPKFPDASGWGKNIQRTMRLLAMSAAEQRNTVLIPILFRLENVSCQDWGRRVS